MGLLGLIIRGLLAIAITVPTTIAAHIGGPVAGLVVGIVAPWLFLLKSGNRRIICIAGGLAGLSGGLVAKLLGGTLGIACGASMTFAVFLVTFFLLRVLVKAALAQQTRANV